MALEDAVTLGEALRVHGNDFAKAFALYQRSRIARTARIVLSAREMGRIFHAKGVERLVRNELWKGRTPERFYDAMEWLYGWNVENCLAALNDNWSTCDERTRTTRRPARRLPRGPDAAEPGAAVAQPARRAAAAGAHAQDPRHLLGLRSRSGRCCCRPAS